MSTTTESFIAGRIATVKDLIVAYEGAITALISGTVQSYTLDTGQSVQKVTKLDIASLQRKVDSLYNQLVTLDARTTGGGSITVRPAY